MKKIILIFFGIVLFTTLTCCVDDLDTEPKIELTLEELLSEDPDAIEGVLSRLYASFALSGPNGPGSSDISDDPGESPFLRGIVNLQDFTADGMKNRWGDDGLDQLTTTSQWTSNNKFFRYLYNRIYYTVPQCNNLLNVLESASVSSPESVTSEVRFLRSLAYFYLIDAFGKGVLATDENFGTSEFLPQASRTELFDYVEGELLEIESTIGNNNGYGRANTFVVDMLLSKLYLNAETYTGTARYFDATTYLTKIINEGGFSLEPNFIKNFSGDNDQSSEIIYPLIADPIESQSYGNTTYIVNGSMSPDTMPILQFGAADGWQGHRATSAWYGLFGDLDTSSDIRASLFWRQGHNYIMTDYREWTDGFPSTKFRNNNLNEVPSSGTSFSGTDFPLYRLSDVYLMYAECALRGASNANMSDALSYVNLVRSRASANAITMTDLDLDFIIDERGRELNLEGHRRTDLIRFGKFTGGSYLWPWKGNTAEGAAIPETYNLFPIPQSALDANPNLQQNTGY
jgi:hypothetical protein